MRSASFILLALALTACSGAEPEATASASPAPAASAPAAYEAPRLEPATVKARQDKGEPILFVDVRSTHAYAEEHLPGAVNVPLAELEAGLSRLPKDRELVVYCTCLEDGSARYGARELHEKHGYGRVAVLKGGMDAWINAGYPFETGAKR